MDDFEKNKMLLKFLFCTRIEVGASLNADDSLGDTVSVCGHFLGSRYFFGSVFGYSDGNWRVY